MQCGNRPSMTISVRTALACDVKAMHAIRNGVQENRLSDPHQIDEASYRRYIEAASAWVAESDDGIVGFAAVDSGSATVWALFVDPQVEGAGIGRALHEHLLAWAHNQGIGTLTLTTGRDTRAASFYRRAGWIEAGSAPNDDVLFVMTMPN